MSINSAGELSKWFELNNPDEWTVSVWALVSFTAQTEPDRQLFTIIDTFCEGKYRKRFSYSIENNIENPNSPIRIGSFVGNELGYIPTSGYGSVPTSQGQQRWVNLNISSSGAVNPGSDWSGQIDFRWIVDGYNEVFSAQRALQFDDVRLREVKFADLSPNVLYSALRVFDIRLNDVQLLENSSFNEVPSSLLSNILSNFTLNDLSSMVDSSGNNIQLLEDGYGQGSDHVYQPPWSLSDLSFNLITSGKSSSNVSSININSINLDANSIAVLDLFTVPISSSLPINILPQVTTTGLDWGMSGGRSGLGSYQGTRWYSFVNSQISNQTINVTLNGTCDFIGYCLTSISGTNLPIVNTEKDGYDISINNFDENSTFFGVYFSISDSPATVDVSSNLTVQNLVRHDNLNIALVTGTRE